MKLRVGFSNTFENAELFFTWAFSQRFDVERDDVNPDYVIYGDANFGIFDSSKFPNSKHIFYTGERVGREYAGNNPAITFDHVTSPKHYRLPLYVLEMWSAVHDDKFTDNFNYLQNKYYGFPLSDELYNRDRKFSYVQTNPNCATRTAFVKKLLEKDEVDCGGPHLNNVGYILPREGGHSAKVNFLRKRRFNIAFENGDHPGYVTEKLLNAFYANTIPIYWGSVTVNRDFNSEAFINAGEYSSFDEVYDKIQEIDKDQKKYMRMLTQPAFRDNIIPSCANIDNFLDWFETFIL